MVHIRRAAVGSRNAFGESSARKTRVQKHRTKKGPPAMSKRPKSREETPKEGSDSARRYRTATICSRAAQSARIFLPFCMQKTQAGLRLPGRRGKFHNQIQ
jgi:hypothetical protein